MGLALHTGGIEYVLGFVDSAALVVAAVEEDAALDSLKVHIYGAAATAVDHETGNRSNSESQNL